MERLGSASGLRAWCWGDGAGRGQAGSGHQLATSQGLLLNSAEDAMECGCLCCQEVGTGPEISGAGLVLQQVASARAHLNLAQPPPHPSTRI